MCSKTIISGCACANGDAARQRAAGVPYESKVRHASKGGKSWVGYKVHLTETCDDERPHLLIQVATRNAPATDLGQLPVIQAEPDGVGFLPAQQSSMPAMSMAAAW